METRFTILLFEIGIALVVQIGILIAILTAVKNSTKRLESMANEVQRRALPTLDAAQDLLTKTKPKIEEIIANAAESAATMKAQVSRLDDTVTDIMDRTRLHVIRADNLVGNTLDRVEQTTELVHTTVISPIRHLSGIVQGLTAGMASFLGRRSQAANDNGQRDEMFI